MDFRNYITKEMISHSYKQGVVRLTTDTEFYAPPAANDDVGVVCAIGDSWFYFGGEEAETSTVKEYTANIPEESIITQIHDTILSLAKDWDLNGDECMYYYTYIKEHLTPDPTNAACLTLRFEVKRKRSSVTQGSVDVYCNGEKVADFGDNIQLIEDGETYYGSLIGNWASKTPDINFIRSTLFHPHDDIYRISVGVKKLINAAADNEMANAKRRNKANETE
jgi:hypothetical protein